MAGRIRALVETALEIAADDTHGYSQINRVGPDFDCSSFLAYCLRSVGFDISVSGSWTGNLLTSLKSLGFVPVEDDEVQAGDIFLTPYHHVALAVNDHELVHARISENGTIDGKPGDQTGTEICVTPMYIPDYGWDYQLRYEEPKKPGELDTAITTIARAVIRGDFGNGHEIRKELIYEMVRTRVNELMKGE